MSSFHVEDTVVRQMKTFLKKHYDSYEIVDKNKFIEAFHYSKNACFIHNIKDIHAFICQNVLLTYTKTWKEIEKHNLEAMTLRTGVESFLNDIFSIGVRELIQECIW